MSTSLAHASLHRMSPPRGPRSVLWVVRGHELAVRDRARVQARGDEAGDVGDVGHDEGARGVGGRPHRREVDGARVGRGADHDDLRLVLDREALQLLVVDPLVLLAHAVGHDLEVLAGEVQRVAVGEVAAVGEVHPEDRVAGLARRHVDGGVGLGAGVRLHVRVVGAEDLLRAGDGQALRHVHELAAAVVAPAGVALGVLVGEDRAERLEHGLGDEVLGGDHLELAALPLGLVADGLRHLGVGPGQVLHQAHLGWVFGSSIFATRRAWRPPAKGVFSHTSRIRSARAWSRLRPPRARTLASLCSRLSRAVSSS